ncbi:MAG: thioredoxin-disulfide reductase [Dehalococcoidia bacterium]|nr:thioredoxin-disulfide reductase [Dehalococcoidia bacterium]
MNQNEQTTRFDVVIIGGGPAGLSAAIYASRDGLSTLLVEKGLIGGMINEADKVDNYPGFSQGISGIELTAKMYEQAQKYGLNNVNAEVLSVVVAQPLGFTIKTSEKEYQTKAVIIAGGSDKVRLGVQGEKEFIGRGVSYCATCDAPFFRAKTVAVIGGGNSAVFEAIHLSKFAKKVYLIHRRDQLRATHIVQEQAKAEYKIEFTLNSVVEEIQGADVLEKIIIKNVIDGQFSELNLDGLFISVGIKPNTSYLSELLELDNDGMIVVDDYMQTSVAGIFACGDIRHNSIRQTIAAAGDGAVAAVNAKKWVERVY